MWLSINIIEIELNNDKYPQRLLKIKNFPTKIYALGNINLLNAKHIIAIVGSRNCTEYGIRVTTQFSMELAKKGISVVKYSDINLKGTGK